MDNIYDYLFFQSLDDETDGKDARGNFVKCQDLSVSVSIGYVYEYFLV
jgi:hypothetical protein